MNGLAANHWVSDCPLGNCRWTSDPLASAAAAHEARRAHINGHTHGELVEHIAFISRVASEYRLTDDAEVA